MSSPEEWETLKKTQLQSECRKRGLAASGNKTQLIERLVRSCGDGNNNELDFGAITALPVDQREDALRAWFAQPTIPGLKELLKAKPQASLKGKKIDLINRLVYYELNSDFRVSVPDDDNDNLANPLSVPDLKCFKDIHGQSPLPPFDKQDISLYLAQYNKKIGKACGMYEEGYLRFVRYCNDGKHTFIYGTTYAEMKKSAQYDVYCKLDADGEVVGGTCECTHGRSSGEAHCKHVTVVLLAVAQCKKEGLVTTEVTCTQQLQTFHQPKKKFRGTPLKARDLKHATNQRAPNLAPISETEMSDEQYQSYFRNLIINSAYNKNMPLKHLLAPANPFAIFNDHDYSTLSTADILLDNLKLRSITTEEIEEIARMTVNQSRSNQWHEYRMPRLTASRFYEILHAEDPMKKAVAVLNHVKFTSKATNHGIKYEPIAIEMYKKLNPNVAVTQTGFVILKSHPCIGATPDFLIDADGIGEVKCPYTSRDRKVDPVNQPYLEWAEDNKTLQLKKKQYYYQVQGQLLVTGRQYCDFVVYTKKDIKIIRINREEEFIASMLSDLVEFFDNFYKEAILRKFLWRDYDKYNFLD